MKPNKAAMIEPSNLPSKHNVSGRTRQGFLKPVCSLRASLHVLTPSFPSLISASIRANMAPVAMKWWNKQPIYRKTPAHGRFLGFFCILALPCSVFAEINGAVTFKENVQPLLAKYCYDCHGEGMNKGKV